ncbi:MAG: bifunctional 23S rRNA (guanine(2069)-N(7))-methyltransferase RlmK/23S rRNA (guanine(2445)-N(2))-methyltransferase RlmL [Planctomycetota bacterium]
MTEYDLIATTAFGLEAVAKRELATLSYEARADEPGRLSFRGDGAAIARTNIELRTAERVLLVVGRFPAPDFGALFDGVRALPWEQWIGACDAILVKGRSVKSQLSSVPACQRIVNKAIVERLKEAHRTDELPESGNPYTVEVALLNDRALLTIDTTGVGLHKRGYRPLVGVAPLRETLAAALVLLSFWRPERPLVDPFCGTGTIPIEAALIGRDLAPGRLRTFAAESWPSLPAAVWEEARRSARDRARGPLPQRILAFDHDESALVFAREHARAAGVDGDIHFQCQDFSDLRSSADYGVVIANPPYGERMGEAEEVEELYQSMPLVLRHLKTWSHYFLTARLDFERIVGRPADRRRKLYNGRIECTYYQFHGPRPGRDAPAASASAAVDDIPAGEQLDAPRTAPCTAPRATPAGAVFGELSAKSREQADLFANRLRKRARHLRRWPTRLGISCFRLYDRDIPEVPLLVDRYGDHLYLAEYERPHDRPPAEHAAWLERMCEVACEVTGVDRRRVFLKHRQRMRGSEQYTRFDQHDLGSEAGRFVADEGGLRFWVDLASYLDTGLFLDHRITRDKVRQQAQGKRFLNLFAYTGSFTVYAAAGGASETTTVDLSGNYLAWAEENLALNQLSGAQHRFVRSDSLAFIEAHDPSKSYDLVVVDPPTFSNSKALEDDWDVQRDHARLLEQLVPLLSSGGTIYFSTNFRKFKFEANLPADTSVREISHLTVPPDFRNRKIHRCWCITRVQP